MEDRPVEPHGMRDVFLEVDRYIYSNWLTNFLTRWGHQAVARLRRFDLYSSTVLDLGCGPGVHFDYVKRAKVVGLDLLPEMVNKARGKARIVQGDMFNLPFRDGSIPSMVSSGVLEHIDPLDGVLQEIKRALMPSGELILLQPCEGWLYELGRKMTTGRHVKKMFGIDYRKYLQTEHLQECRPLLEQVGQVLHLDRIMGVPFPTSWISVNAFVAVRYTKERQ